MSDETKVTQEYGAEQIQVLEGSGSGAEKTRYVYRLYLLLRSAPPRL